MSSTYRVSHYQEIAKVAPEHFWFRARAAMLTAFIGRYIAKGERASAFLEIGCGTGSVLRVLTRLGFEVVGLDVNEAALTFARVSCPTARLVRSSIYSLSDTRRYRTVGAFDVLEHQTRDGAFLKRCWRLLEEGGTLFLTVPAGRWLWSRLDELSGHKRRYEADELREKLRAAGFHVLYMNYWNVCALPWYLLFRMYANRQTSTPIMLRYLRIPNGCINALLYYMLRAEQLFSPWFPFSCGATLVVCARKVTV